MPGTETCLKIGGYVRAQVNMYERTDGDFGWDMFTRGRLVVEAKNDSELGTIGSYIAMQADGDADGETAGVYLDEAYITVGGFKVGYLYNYWDTGLAGETDDLGSNLLNSVGYEYTSDAFSFGVFVDELNKTYTSWDPAFDYYGGADSIGIEAQLSGTFGVATATLLGAYDFAAENGAVRAIVEAEVGPGTLGVAGVWSSGANAYYDLAEWTVAASYSAKLTDKLTLTPGAQYFWNYGHADVDGDFIGSNDAWAAGLTLDYALAEGLALKANVEYLDEGDLADDGEWSGFVRLQRSF
ncbi:MAG: hypothetical protein CTR54_00005 [Rhizobium sp.]|nr:MAG: hypothetical protein CTR54_00005 [Rhizobium sp.]